MVHIVGLFIQLITMHGLYSTKVPESMQPINFENEKCEQKSTKLLRLHLKTKRRLLYLKTQFVTRSKHFSSRL